MLDWQIHIETHKGNVNNFQSMMENTLRFVEDHSDPLVQKAALMFLNRAVSVWVRPVSTTANGQGSEDTSVPGFERFMYESILPSVFTIPSAPGLNPKDGATTTASTFISLACSWTKTFL